jgi:taurine dioxygenase
MKVTRLAAALGAEVTGLDLRDPSDQTLRDVGDLLLEHHVLMFPGQFLDHPQHVALGHWFGPIEGHPTLTNPFPDHPEIFELAASKGGIADEWHTDLTFLKHPSVMSILNMVRCPDVGGDTMWANAALAYDELSEPIRDLLDGLTALHDESPHGKPDVTMIHPVVRVHPITGRRVLYVNEHFTRRIVELSAQESSMLLAFLTKWVSSERFTMRYRWSEGTIAMWDNRCTQHFVVNDFVGERVIQRVTVMGDDPEGNSPRWSPHTATRGDTSRYDRQLKRHLRAASAEGNSR